MWQNTLKQLKTAVDEESKEATMSLALRLNLSFSETREATYATRSMIHSWDGMGEIGLEGFAKFFTDYAFGRMRYGGDAREGGS